MLNLLSSEGDSHQVHHVSTWEELKVNPLLKRIQPDKQALSEEELIKLISADQLDLDSAGGEPTLDSGSGLEGGDEEQEKENPKTNPRPS